MRCHPLIVPSQRLTPSSPTFCSITLRFWGVQWFLVRLPRLFTSSRLPSLCVPTAAPLSIPVRSEMRLLLSLGKAGSTHPLSIEFVLRAKPPSAVLGALDPVAVRTALSWGTPGLASSFRSWRCRSGPVRPSLISRPYSSSGLVMFVRQPH